MTEVDVKRSTPLLNPNDITYLPMYSKAYTLRKPLRVEERLK